MTIFDNTEAFGLMPKDRQDAIKKHYELGGTILVYIGDGRFETISDPTWRKPSVYRAR